MLRYPKTYGCQHIGSDVSWNLVKLAQKVNLQAVHQNSNDLGTKNCIVMSPLRKFNFFYAGQNYVREFLNGVRDS